MFQVLFALILLFDADGKKDAHVDASLQARPDHPIAILGTKSRVDDAWVTIQVAHKCFLFNFKSSRF